MFDKSLKFNTVQGERPAIITKCKLLFTLSDEIGTDSGLTLGDSVLLLAECYALHKECHVLSESSHGLKSLSVLKRICGTVAVYHIPVLACNDRHTANCKIFIQSIKKDLSNHISNLKSKTKTESKVSALIL